MPQRPPLRLAVLGLGSMGRALAGRLVDQGHAVCVWNRTPGRAAELTGRGATAAADPAAAAAGRDAVLLSLADDRAVLAVAGEGGGLADALGAAVLVDTSTVSPATSRRLAAAVGRDQMVAAPIMGPPAAVAGGAATYLLGGPEATVARLEPLWESLSSSHRWCGEDPGTATTFKVLGNYLLMSGLAALSEVVAVAQAAGLGDPALREFLGQSPLVAPALQNRLDDMVDGDHRGWFAARLGAKDVALFEELAAAAGLRPRLAEAVRGRYEALDGLGLSDADIAAVVELLRP